MSESFSLKPKNKTEQPEEAFQGEESLFATAAGKIRGIKYIAMRTARTKALATLFFLASASSAFAQEGNTTKLDATADIRLANRNTISAESIAPTATTETTIKKISLTQKLKDALGKFSLDISHSSYSDINIAGNMDRSTDYGVIASGLSKQEARDVVAIKDLIGKNDLPGFRVALKEQTKNWTLNQKLTYLGKTAADLSAIYDIAQLSKGVKYTSNEELFKALQAYNKTGKIDLLAGVCGPHHTFLASLAQELGIEAWAQEGKTQSSLHAVTGMMLEVNGKKEIVFINYGAVIKTGTDNYRDAFSVLERQLNGVGLGEKFFTDKDGNAVTFVKSRATEKLEEVAGIKGTEEILENTPTINKSLEIQINPESQKFEISQRYINLMVTNYQNKKDYFNSIKELQALRLGLKAGLKGFSIKNDISVVHMQLKDIQGSNMFFQDRNIPTNYLINNFVVNWFGNKEITKSEYGKLMLEMGGTAQIAVQHTLSTDRTVYGNNLISDEYGAKGRLVFIGEKGKFFIEAKSVQNIGFKNFRGGSDLRNFNLLTQLKIGGSVQVHEGTIVGFNAAVRQEFGTNSYKAGIDLKMPNFSFSVEGRQENSKLIQLQENTGVTLSATKILTMANVPKAEISVYGTIGRDKDSNKNQMGLQTKVFLW